jgi:hypothetical protein
MALLMKVLALALIGACTASSWTEMLELGSHVQMPPLSQQEIAFRVKAFTSACPGGDLNLCGRLCPSWPPQIYSTCMDICGVRCGGGGGVAPIPTGAPVGLPFWLDTASPRHLVGNDRDEHGCIGSAGQTWCAAKSKCIGPGESCSGTGTGTGTGSGDSGTGGTGTGGTGTGTGGNPVAPPPIGGDKDEHGCLIAAGQKWCAAKSKCIGPGEVCTGGGGTGGGGTGGGPHGNGNGGAWPANGGGSLAKCVVNTPAKASNGAECKDLPDSEFKAFWHTLKDTHWHAFKHEKTCEHAMFQGECSDLHIRNACCKSCTADDGSICVDKEASEVSRRLGLTGVSCGTLAAAGRCNHADVRKHCCAMCRMYCVNPTCKDVTEQELRHEVGKVEGEGGCPHAAAQDKCTHSSLYHKRCCASCILHADIQK